MDLLYFGDNGWGDELAIATLMTIAVSITAMLIGFIFAALFTPLKLSKNNYRIYKGPFKNLESIKKDYKDIIKLNFENIEIIKL